MVCPWDRFSASNSDPALAPRDNFPHLNLIRELELTSEEFNHKFKNSPVKRAKRRGYLRNVAIALGNSENAAVVPALKKALNYPEPMVRTHAAWALKRIENKPQTIDNE